MRKSFCPQYFPISMDVLLLLTSALSVALLAEVSFLLRWGNFQLYARKDYLCCLRVVPTYKLRLVSSSLRAASWL